MNQSVAEVSCYNLQTVDTTLVENKPEARPGKLIYSRWLVIVLVLLAAVLAAEWLLIWRSYLGPEETMRHQIEALQHKDYAEAYRYSALEIRQRLDLGQFREMVERQYPEMIESRKYEIKDRRIGENQARFRVTVSASDGASLELVYDLGLESGHWRVRGVSRIDGNRRPPGNPRQEVTT